ncbi:hypothetical protein D0Y65_041355 [Glycine soja]|uniref:Uncharacterized protein n=1 Tax=Glycine soja TaxID=3848 RepID=A0A445GVF0_GLYSO|nr:hypothetical protein D0Y65_041355 [Glycine soja]
MKPARPLDGRNKCSHLGKLSCPASPFMFRRLEYEQNRDMNSRIQELEASLGSLDKDLKHGHHREAAAKLAAENATE